MEKTDAELFEDFKAISGRSDWTNDDFNGCRFSYNNIIDQLEFLLQGIMYYQCLTDEGVQKLNLISKEIFNKCQDEITRRTT